MAEPRGISSNRAPPLPHPYRASKMSQKIRATVSTLAKFSGGLMMASQSWIRLESSETSTYRPCMTYSKVTVTAETYASSLAAVAKVSRKSHLCTTDINLLVTLAPTHNRSDTFCTTCHRTHIDCLSRRPATRLTPAQMTSPVNMKPDADPDADSNTLDSPGVNHQARS